MRRCRPPARSLHSLRHPQRLRNRDGGRGSRRLVEPIMAIIGPSAAPSARAGPPEQPRSFPKLIGNHVEHAPEALARACLTLGYRSIGNVLPEIEPTSICRTAPARVRRASARGTRAHDGRRGRIGVHAVAALRDVARGDEAAARRRAPCLSAAAPLRWFALTFVPLVAVATTIVVPHGPTARSRSRPVSPRRLSRPARPTYGRRADGVRSADVAQLVEQLIRNQQVVRSNRIVGSKNSP